jgi:hypothetical protein
MTDYLEDSVVYDMKNAMEAHMEHCESCRKLYEEEKQLDDMFRDTFKVDNIKFSSSRSLIMKNIEKNKYSNTLGNKINYHLKRYGVKYFSSVAILIFAFFSAPYLLKGGIYTDTNKSMKEDAMEFQSQIARSDSNSTVNSDLNTTMIVPNIAPQQNINSNAETKKAPVEEVNKEETNIPQFIKKELDAKAQLQFATKWKKSPNGKLQVSLEGRGESGGDEGVANIVLDDIDANKKWAFSLANNNLPKQITPYFLEWADNENLFTTIATATGHATYGGRDLFMVNASTGKNTLLYETSTAREQIYGVKKSDGNLTINFKVFEDDAMNKSRNEEKTINFKEVTDKNLASIKVLYDYATDINNQQYTEATKKLQSINEGYETQVGNFKLIQRLDFTKAVDITGEIMIDNTVKQYSDYKVYLVEVSSKTYNSALNATRTELIYQKVITVKEKSTSTWLIYKINTMSQTTTN